MKLSEFIENANNMPKDSDDYINNPAQVKRIVEGFLNTPFESLLDRLDFLSQECFDGWYNALLKTYDISLSQRSTITVGEYISMVEGLKKNPLPASLNDLRDIHMNHHRYCYMLKYVIRSFTVDSDEFVRLLKSVSVNAFYDYLASLGRPRLVHKAHQKLSNKFNEFTSCELLDDITLGHFLDMLESECSRVYLPWHDITEYQNRINSDYTIYKNLLIDSFHIAMPDSIGHTHISKTA